MGCEPLTPTPLASRVYQLIRSVRSKTPPKPRMIQVASTRSSAQSRHNQHLRESRSFHPSIWLAEVTSLLRRSGVVLAESASARSAYQHER